MTDNAALVERLRHKRKLMMTHEYEEVADALEACRSNLHHTTAAIKSIREHTLEEAAQVVERITLTEHGISDCEYAAAIRALKENKL